MKTTKKSLHRAGALLAAAALLTLTVPTAEAAIPPTGPDSAVSWSSCPAPSPGTGPAPDPRQQCGTVDVPLDYGSPGGPQITLAVSRLATARPELRRGTLLMVPGGPGGSGLNGPSGAVGRLPKEVLDRYDVMGFDPRGVGRSAPVSCGLAHEDLTMTRLRPWPAPGGSVEANATIGRRVAETCARNGGPVIRTMSTANEARDIDRIRQALGERRLSLWGVSYGTYAGAVYATRYPQHTDRVLLDSNDDPDPAKVGRGWLAAFDASAEDRFPDFAAWASAPGNPDQVADTPAAVRPLFLQLAARLDQHPLPWPGANPAELSGNALRETMLESLYSDAKFPGLARLMLAAQGLRPLPPAATPPDDALQNTVAASVGTLCGDVTWPGSVADHARAVAADRLAHPLTAGMPVNLMPCSFWPYPPSEPPVRITPDGPANVLLIQNLRDPATPYAGALKLREVFGHRARMVAVDSGGHDAYLANGNACGDALVTDFLVTGHRPAQDTRCPAPR
ncbi:alpha/beta hydrolase [Kitasatospora sp. NPDC002227]|uniref:alpha/beta hydrolase n=1 Tax=Kitasatospora sp. NPDC002227 TaxID=3154773 RepID=UPI00332D4DAB